MAPAPSESVPTGTQASIEREFREQLGDEAWAEVSSASTSIALRRSVSLPRMIQQPDGSYRPEQPGVVGAVRTSSGWVRITRGDRSPFDPLASRELDRLVASPKLWSEPSTSALGCTDPAGVSMILRHPGRERVSAQPCGAQGLTGRVGEIVMAGRVLNWSGTPAEVQPEGLPLGRLPEEVIRGYRFSSGIYDARTMVIRNDREWLGQWQRITSGRSASPPPVDFSREMLLFAGMGTRPTGGYSVDIERVIDTGSDLEAHVVHRSPGPRCGTTQAITRPLDIVRVPASPKNVRWVVRQAVTDCR